MGVEARDSKLIKGAVLVTGWSEGMVQVLVLREILSGFSGSELVSVMFLAAWMVLNALSCFLALRISLKGSLRGLARLQLAVGLAAVLTTIGAQAGCSLLASNAHFQIDWLSYTGLAVIALLPFGILSGYQYVASLRYLAGLPGCQAVGAANSNYILNSTGMVLGFLAATFISAPCLNTLQSSVLILSLNLIMVLCFVVYLQRPRKRAVLLAGGLILLLAGSLMVSQKTSQFYQQIIAWRMPAEKLIEVKDTDYSRLMASYSQGQYNIYSNNYLTGVWPEKNPAMEKHVHFIMRIHPDPQRILVVGGLAGGVLQEVNKYQPRAVCYVDIDPGAFYFYKKYTHLTTGRGPSDFRYIKEDLRSYLTHTRDRYDVIIMIPPEPANLAANRFYTREFFMMLDRVMEKDGMICTSIGSTDVYAGDNLKRKNCSIMQAIHQTFAHSLVIPGEEGIIIAAHQLPNEADLRERLSRSDNKIKTNMVSQVYAEKMLDARRLAMARSYFVSNRDCVTNSDFYPSALLYNTVLINEQQNLAAYKPLLWLTGQRIRSLILYTCLLLILPMAYSIAYMKYWSREQIGLTRYIAFITGLIGMSGISIIIYLYQIKVGSLYGNIGLITAANLAGYASGAASASYWKSITKLNLPGLLLAIGVMLALILPVVRTDINIPSTLFLIFAAIWGFFNGAVYPWLNRQKAAGDHIGIYLALYLFEVLGAALGAILVGGLLLSAIGVKYTLILIMIPLALTIALSYSIIIPAGHSHPTLR